MINLLIKIVLVLAAVWANASFATQHPNLVINHDDVVAMRAAIDEPGRFQQEFQHLRKKVDQEIASGIQVPKPKDAGGGYTHERHKKNYIAMYNAGVLYQLTQEQKYADYVRDMLLQYAKMYPSLPLHPKRKKGKDNPGKLFWQSLNEAVWLVYSIQAYDLVFDGIKPKQRDIIEQGIFRPIADFLSKGSAVTFNKIHNHGTWLTAGVGMTGYVLGDEQMAKQALLGLDLSGKGGFLKQLEKLFSPQGYYTEGPYYQRYALMPFVTFAKAINNNEPQRHIFDYRDHIVLKAIKTTIDLSYNGLFFPINDAIKSKGIDTIELVHGVAVAYGITKDNQLLDIAKQQNRIILTGDGLKVAKALDAGLARKYDFHSQLFGDGPNGNEGALVIMRGETSDKPAVLFKATSQGMGHGHFDKLTWQFYHQGVEIVSDYGAARFLNVEAKSGGRYLPENKTYAKQTIAHNTVVVDEQSHFYGKLALANQSAPHVLAYQANKFGTFAAAKIDTAYKNVSLLRSVALVKLPNIERSLAIDVFDVDAKQAHQFDLPLYYQGQFIATNFAYQAADKLRKPLGEHNGYQHLWLTAQASPKQAENKFTWLNNGHFYTLTMLNEQPEQILFTQIGASDPNFNLRNEQGFIRRVNNTKHHTFVSILEAHGEYNPAQEYTLGAQSQLTNLHFEKQAQLLLISFDYAQKPYLVVMNLANTQLSSPTLIQYLQQTYSINQNLMIFAIKPHQE
jgi:hypothetical protein